MTKVRILLLLPLLIRANINIEITTSEEENARQIYVYGSEVDIISNEEINTFQLTDENLKKSVESYLGINPEAVFQESLNETDLNATYNWTHVSRTIKPVRVKTMSINYESTLVMTKLIKNKNLKETNFTIQIRKDVENTIDSVWVTDGALMSDKNISYSFRIMSASGESIMSYASGFGNNVHKSQTVSIGYDTGVNITLIPNQRARIDLYTTNSVSTVQIDYNASLSGTIAVKRGDRYWHSDVSSVLEAGGLNTYLLSSETMSLCYNSDFEVSVRDRDKNHKLDYYE